MLSAYLYVGHLSHILYGLSLFSFVYILSFFLSVRGLSLLLTLYAGCLLCLYCYYRTYTRIHTRNETPNLTPKISDLTRSFLPRRSSPSSLTTASTVLLLTLVNRLTSPSPLLPLSVRNPRSTRPSLLLLPPLPCPVKHRGIDTALLSLVGTDCICRSLPSPTPGICPAAPNNRNTPCTPRTRSRLTPPKLAAPPPSPLHPDNPANCDALPTHAR